jgi:Holliday junction resolvase RusA-like endonuclease
MIHFTLDIEPKPKQRPRFNGRSGRVYTQDQTLQFERDVRRLASEHISEPLMGALGLEVLFVHPRLKSEPKKRSGRKYKSTKPDLSNLVKSLEDGLEGVAFKNDAQIVSLSAEKVYASLNEPAHIEVTLHQVSDDLDVTNRLFRLSNTQREEGASACDSNAEMTQMTHINAQGERGANVREDCSSKGQKGHSNARGEGDASAREVDPDRPLTAQERRELKAKRREINRAEHKRAQEAKNERISRERSAIKLRKLIEVEDRRRAEREEQERARELERERSMQELYERYRVRRSSATQEDGDE